MFVFTGRLEIYLVVFSSENNMKPIRLRESAGWNPIFTTPRVDAEIQLVAMHTKFGPQGSDKMLAVSLANGTILLWSMDDDNGTKKG